MGIKIIEDVKMEKDNKEKDWVQVSTYINPERKKTIEKKLKAMGTTMANYLRMKLYEL